MPVTLQVREGGRLIHVTTSDPYSIEEFRPLFAKELAHRTQFMAEHPGEKVHLLIDMTQAKSAAANFLRARDTSGLSHPTSGYVVLVGTNRLIRALSETVMRMARFRQVHFADSVNDGMAFLRPILDTPPV